MTTNFFPPVLLLLFLDPGSGMGKNQDPGSWTHTPDPQPCILGYLIDIWPTRSNTSIVNVINNRWANS
jgi:hypothetical protein